MQACLLRTSRGLAQPLEMTIPDTSQLHIPLHSLLAPHDTGESEIVEATMEEGDRRFHAGNLSGPEGTAVLRYPMRLLS